MTKKPLLSVIIPVYNGVKYIDAIIETFDRQTNRDFELIFTDDGSFDGSSEKINEYIEKTDFPIILQKQKNEGVSAARNNGAKLASGKFISFVDCDDSVTDDYVEMLKSAENSEFDVLVFQSLIVGENDSYNSMNENKEIKQISRLNMLERFISNPTALGVCNLFINRDFYLENRLEFRTGCKYYEDYEFLYKTFAAAKEIKISEYQMYFYIKRENSAMARFVPDRLSCMAVIEELKPFIASVVPEFLPTFEKWGTARLYWSVMWQASLAFGIRDALRFAKRAYIRQEMRKLKNFRSKKVRLTSCLFRVSPFLFILAAKAVGKRHSKVSASDFLTFEEYFDSRPKKILVYGMTENRGGIEAYIMNLYRNIDRSALRFDFMTDWKTMAYTEEVQSLGSKIFHIPAKRESLFKHIKNVSKIIKNHREYDSVYFNILNAGAVFTMLPCFLKGRNIIVHSHNSSDANMKLHNLCKKPLNIIAKCKLACSKPAAVFMFGEKSLAKGKVLLINNAINVSEYEYDPKIREKKREELGISDKFAVIHIGRMSAEKNPMFLLDIFAELKKNLPESVLLYVGTGEMKEEIIEYSDKLGIYDFIKFLGMRKDVPELLCAADIFLLPSLFEGLPISALEAQAADLPCFVSDEISEALKLTEKLEFISLSASPSKWAEKIAEAKDSFRKSRAAEFQNSDYDIKTEAGKIAEILK